MTNKLLALAVLSLVACKDKAKTTEAAPKAAEPAPTATTRAAEPAVKPAEAPAAKAEMATMPLGAGESLASVQEGGKNVMTLTVDGKPLQLALVSKDKKVWLRAAGGSQQWDVTAPEEMLDEDTLTLQAPKSGPGVVLHRQSLVDRKPEVGALFEYDDQLITWDAAASKPVVSNKWSCDETKAKGGVCEGGF